MAEKLFWPSTIETHLIVWIMSRWIGGGLWKSTFVFFMHSKCLAIGTTLLFAHLRVARGIKVKFSLVFYFRVFNGQVKSVSGNSSEAIRFVFVHKVEIQRICLSVILQDDACLSYIRWNAIGRVMPLFKKRRYFWLLGWSEKMLECISFTTPNFSRNRVGWKWRHNCKRKYRYRLVEETYVWHILKFNSFQVISCIHLKESRWGLILCFFFQVKHFRYVLTIFCLK